MARKMINMIKQTRFLMACVFIVTCSTAQAEETRITEVEEINIPLSGDTIKANTKGPIRGTSMKTVEAKYGKPLKIHPTKGKPPITRWDYPEFSVYFESNSVIHTVSRSN